MTGRSIGKWVLLCIAVILVVGLAGQVRVLAQDSTPVWPTDGWRTSTPEEQGMDSGQLAALFEALDNGGGGLHSVLVIRNGFIVTEAYFGIYHQDTQHILYSVTKSFISSLVGIAQEDGAIEGLDQPVLSYFPDRTVDNLDARKQAITLEHLLTMSAGLDWPENDYSGCVRMVSASDDWAQYMLDRPMINDPGAAFHYSSGVSVLIGAVVQQATGQDLEDFAVKRLFEPLGISDYEWEADPTGLVNGGYGLHLAPRDMAKFGYLFLNEGVWDGEQIVPADWVATSTSPHIVVAGDYNYGYQWWVPSEQDYYAALGYQGQRIVVVPDLELVVVFTALLNNDSIEETLLHDYILPAAVSDEPLPPNPDGVAQLEAAMEAVGASDGSESARTLYYVGGVGVGVILIGGLVFWQRRKHGPVG
ncbi:MAG: serine hydrolase [Anaerolineae bacterium]|nr:serine hydrolase [Anaerolineae bacterium]